MTVSTNDGIMCYVTYQLFFKQNGGKKHEKRRSFKKKFEKQREKEEKDEER